MSYPSNRYEMKRAGYTLVKAKACDQCDARIETWKTSSGKYINMDAPANGGDMESVAAHRFTCKPKKSAQQSLWQGTMPQRQEAVSRLADACRARAIVVLQDDGMVFSCRKDIDLEDVRHELITAANQIRRDMEEQHG